MSYLSFTLYNIQFIALLQNYANLYCFLLRQLKSVFGVTFNELHNKHQVGIYVDTLD